MKKTITGLLCMVFMFTSCDPPETWGQSAFENNTSETVLREVGTVGNRGSATPEEAVEGYMHYFFLQSDEAWEYAYIAEDSEYFVYDQIPDPLIEDYYYAFDRFAKKLLAKNSFIIIATEKTVTHYIAEETVEVTIEYTYYSWYTIRQVAAEELGEKQPSMDEYIARMAYTTRLLNLQCELLDIYDYEASTIEIKFEIVKVDDGWYVVVPDEETTEFLYGFIYV